MRRSLNWLIVIAFAVRSLLPVGMMLTAAHEAGGLPQIVICTGHGPLTLTLDEKGVPRPAKAPASDKTTCPFSSAGSVAVTDKAPALLADTVRYAAVSYRITSEIFRATPRAGAQSARGPPVA